MLVQINLSIIFMAERQGYPVRDLVQPQPSANPSGVAPAHPLVRSLKKGNLGSTNFF